MSALTPAPELVETDPTCMYCSLSKLLRLSDAVASVAPSRSEGEVRLDTAADDDDEEERGATAAAVEAGGVGEGVDGDCTFALIMCVLFCCWL